MKVLKGKKEGIEKLAVEDVTRKIKEILKKKEKVVLGVVGGASISGILKKLSKAEINWTKVHFFMVDERFVPINDKESNFRIVKENLSKRNLHSFNYKKPISYYQKEFNKFGGKFGIVMLSSGEDGHIASLFPNHPSIKNNSDDFIEINKSPKPPSKRMSASRKLIKKSDYSVLLFFGENKKEAYKKFSDEKLSIIECPAKIVKEIKDSLVLISF